MKKNNKLISILLVLAMFLSMAPISAFAAETPPTVEIGGITYYELDSADDLDWFAAQVNGGNTSINAALTKDITYNPGTMSASSTGARVWTPIGTYEMPFEGIINGNGYTISGLYSKDPESPNLAFVSYSVKATITNVALTNFYFESKHGLVAGLASYAAGSTIHNCYAQGSIYAKDAGAAAAGICAAVFGHSKTKILNCLSDVALKVDDPSDFTVSGISVKNYIGGIICTGDKNNPVLIQNTVYITDRYNGTVYDENNSLASHFEIYDSEGMPASKLATGEIAYILGNGWGQKLGTDSIPRIGNSNVVNYGYVSCDADAQKVYTNSATNPNYPEHYDSETDSDNACDFCGTNLHTHSFTYSASGDTITAVCENTYGNCPDPEGTLTILAPADLYADGITAKEATIENNLVDTSVAISDITYSAPYGLPPKDAGTYTASVTVGGATATVEFTLLNYAATVTDKDGNAVGTYKTFAEAITAASASEGSTVTLLDDVTLTKEQNIRSGEFTLDLNGKNLINENGRVLYIFEEVDLTIKDSGETGTLESMNTGSYAIWNYGTLTVESGNIKGDGGIDNKGTLTFKDGTAEAVTYSAIYNTGTAYVYDGVLKDAESLALGNYGTLYVYDGEIDGVSNDGTAYISGGEIDCDNYAALNLLGGMVEVTGGSFTGTDLVSGYYSGTPYGEWTVYYSEDATLTLKGGEFPNGFAVAYTTANALLAEGYAFYDKDGNKISVTDDTKIIGGYVQVKDHYVASVTDKDGNEIGSYKTFAEAITAASASEDSTLTLLDDITLTETARISSGKFTLDLNGKTILNKTDDALMLYYGANITIKDSGEGGTVETVGDYRSGIVNSAELTVESGTVKGHGTAIKNNGTLIINDGNFESCVYGAITNKGTAKIYGGVFEGIEDRGEGIQNDASGEVYIYGGKIIGGTALLNSGTAYISGGEFTGNDYAAINILKGTVEVTGGSFTGTDFSDGYFSGTPYGEWTVDFAPGATFTLKGGEFPNGFVIDETTANALLAEDYYYKDADGKLIDVADDATIINGYVKVSKGAALEDAVITLDSTEFTYNGSEIKPTVIVTVGGKTLTEGTDYTVSYANNINADTATVTVKGAGDYTGEATMVFTIVKADSTVTAAPVSNTLTYKGEAQDLISAGEAMYGTMVYSLDGTEYSETIPQGTNAGYYTVYYKVIGDSNHNDTVAETVTVTIDKKPVSVYATVPDRIYGESVNCDTTKVVITFDGIVEGDDVGYVVTDAWYHSHNVTNNAPVQVDYNVNGADADNYQFPEFGEYLAPNYGVQATGRVLPRDIANAEITLGDALVYNGAEQTQTVAAVTVDGLEVTYTVSGNKATNVGVYELTITGNGNFAGETTALYEIAPDTTGIDALTVDNVKSSDKEAIEAVAQQIENAVTNLADDEKKAEYKAITDKCDELIEKIDATAEAIEEIENAANGFDSESITSDDKAEIEEIIAEIEKVNPDNLTDEQKAEYEEIKAGFEALLEEIAAAEKDVADIGAQLEMFDEERVTKFWEDDIEALKAKIDELLADENMGEAEIAKLNEYKAQAEKLIEIINDPCEYFSLRFFYLIWDCLTWKYNGILWLFARLFG